MSGRMRRHFSVEETVKILRLHLVEGKAIWDLCDEHALQLSVFYHWQRPFFENGAGAFEPKGPDRPSAAAGGTDCRSGGPADA